MGPPKTLPPPRMRGPWVHPRNMHPATTLSSRGAVAACQRVWRGGGRNVPPLQLFTPSCPLHLLFLLKRKLEHQLQHPQLQTPSPAPTPGARANHSLSLPPALRAGWETEALQANLLRHRSGTSRGLLTRRAAESSQLWHYFTIRSRRGDRGCHVHLCLAGGDIRGDQGLAPACWVSFWK